MELDDYQKQAVSTAIYPDKGNNITYPILGLTNEAGEVAGKLKKLIRDGGGVLTDEWREKISDELGDVLWYCAALAHELGTNFSTVAIKNLAKLKSRQERGTLSGSGDTR